MAYALYTSLHMHFMFLPLYDYSPIKAVFLGENTLYSPLSVGVYMPLWTSMSAVLQLGTTQTLYIVGIQSCA